MSAYFFSSREFAESWNEVFEGMLAQVVLPLSPSRAEKTRRRMKEHPEMRFWEKVFQNIALSDFLSGKRSDWKCSFDFVVGNDTNCLKIFEGEYENGKNQQNGRFSYAARR